MTAMPWWKSGVIYQIAVSSFADSDGDGRGDLRGIIGKLDYLSDTLGVDAVWLTPVNTSPLQDFGYDVADYYAVDPRFGTMADFDELLGECHARGIRVIMDMVLNHTSEQHPWFAESRSSRDNPKRDWYVWRDGRRPGRPPNRWVAMVEGSAWEFDAASGQYYYHAFLPFQPDLNWRNPAVRNEMLRVVEFWLEKGVDGFRLDLINFLFEDEACRDNPRSFGWRPYFWQKHVRDRSLPESLETARALRRLTDRFEDRAMLGEVCTDDPAEALAYAGDGGDTLHLPFYLDFALRPWGAKPFRDAVAWMEGHVPSGGWPCYYLNNHDLKRTFTRFGGGSDADLRVKVAAAMLLTLRGTPILYYGEEIGMRQSAVPRGALDDPVGKRYWPLEKGRDGSRTPMQWSADPGAGFTTGTPWLPVDPSYPYWNVEGEREDPDSVLNWYRALLGLRRKHLALQTGTYRALDSMPRGVFGYVREADGRTVTVLLNFRGRTSEPLRLAEHAASSTEVLLSSRRRKRVAGGRDGLRLAPYEVLVFGATAPDEAQR
ncbi:MAG: DUF3459 domain-containing protein [Actinobacteria bacterium]|nr:DUF3459 domain-containing protein [Actinomycetota bacterium]